MKNTRVPTKITAYPAAHRAMREMKADGDARPTRRGVAFLQQSFCAVRVLQRVANGTMASLRVITGCVS
jgi:hypothetical protein